MSDPLVPPLFCIIYTVRSICNVSNAFPYWALALCQNVSTAILETYFLAVEQDVQPQILPLKHIQRYIDDYN